MSRSRKKIGYVYFVRVIGEEKIKIGYTSSLPTQRITQLAVEEGVTLEVVGLLVGTKVREQELHQEFSDLNIEGEWFRPGERLEQFVDDLEYNPQGRLKELVGLQFDDRGRMTRSKVTA